MSAAVVLTDLQADTLRALHDEMAEFGDRRYYVRGVFLRLHKAGHLHDLPYLEQNAQPLAVMDELADLGLVSRDTDPLLVHHAHWLTSAGYRWLGEPVPDVVTFNEGRVSA